MGLGSVIKAKLSVDNFLLRAVMAEFLGTFILLTFGNGSVAQSVLSHGAYGEFLSINWAWGIGVAMGVWVSGGVSGGHINPAVTMTMCVLGRTPWTHLFPYWLAQYLGAIVSSAIVFGVYHDAMDNFDGGVRQVVGENATAGIFSTYPKDFLATSTGFGDQVVGTGLLLICVLAITDKRNMTPPPGLVPLALGLLVAAIGMSFGFNCGYAINPARDWGPRIFTLMAGWGTETFSLRDYNWFWVPFVGPHIGAILGGWTYNLLVGLHFPDETNDTVPEPKYNARVSLEMTQTGEHNAAYNSADEERTPTKTTPISAHL